MQGLLGYSPEFHSYSKSNVKALRWHDLTDGLKSSFGLFFGE